MSHMGFELSDLATGMTSTITLKEPLPDFPDATRPGEFLNALPAAIYMTDAAGRITYFNEAAATMWGRRPKLNVDLWCGSWRLFWPDGTPMPHDACPMAITLKERRAVRGGQAIAERPDGSRVPFMAFPTPLHDASGAFVGAVNMLIDMSEHQRAEQMSHRLAAIVETSADAIISKDLNGVIATWNKGAERLFGYLEQEAIGKPITMLIPEQHRDEETRILERIRSGERIDHFETVRRRKDGSLVSISLTVSPITDGLGRIVGASKIARDITEQKRREEQITPARPRGRPSHQESSGAGASHRASHQRRDRGRAQERDRRPAPGAGQCAYAIGAIALGRRRSAQPGARGIVALLRRRRWQRRFARADRRPEPDAGAAAGASDRAGAA